MMSVPAINSVLPPSGNQPAKINSSPTASPSVSPLGISVPPKLSAIPPPQIPTNTTKPPLGVNHSQVPLSLVYENKVVGSQGQPAVSKPTADKPKDLSPSKPTSNGVESTTIKAPPNTQPPQQSTPPSSKTEDVSVQKTTINHSEERSPPKSEPAPSGDEPAPSSTPQPQNATPEKVDQSQNENISKQGEGSSQEEVKEEKEKKDSKDESAKAESSSEKAEEKTASTGHTSKRKREQKPDEKKEEEPEPEKKTRRIRSQVLPYQSPLPELATFINKSLKEKDASQKSNEERLIVFYKNEFLAVRNAEGGFYLCQTLQNVYRTSHRIRIRWLSQKKEGSGDEGDVYAPDFYDLTDFECILTTVALNKMEKNMYKLRKVELERIENILKRALDVEKGVTEKPSITEEHPDGIDLSLYKDESQLQKPKATKRKASSPDRKSPKQAKKSAGGEASTSMQTTRTASKKSSKTGKKVTKSAPKKVKGKKGKSESSKSKAADQLKVSPPNEKARVVAKVLRKVEIAPAKDVSTKKAKSKTAKRSPAVSKSQTKKKGQKNGKKASQDGAAKEQQQQQQSAQSHHERRQGKNKYSNNKNKKN